MRVSNCIEFEQLLEQSIETRRPIVEDDVRAHVSDCAECSAAWNDHLLLERAIADWQWAASVDCDLADAILARHALGDAAERNVPQSSTQSAGEFSKRPASARPAVSLTIGRGELEPAGTSRGTALAVLAVAAAVLVAAMIPFDGPTGTPPAPPAAHVAKSDAEPAIEPDIEPNMETAQADVDTMVRDAQTAYLQLALGAADVVTDGAVLIPERAVAAPEPASTADDGSNVSPLSRGLEPIRRDVGEAIDFLLQTISTQPKPTT